MKKRRTRRVALTTFAVLGVAAFACTFPDVTFAPEGFEGGTGGGEGGAQDAPSTPADGGLTDGPLLFADAFAAGDATVVQDDAGKTDAGVCADGCDCDGDNSENADSGCNAGGTIPDCDDYDERAQPGMGYRYEAAEAPMFGNWNCENGVQKLYVPNLNCSNVALNACPNAVGFKNDPACGANGVLIGCRIQTDIVFNSCVEDPSRTDAGRQACK